MLRKQTRHVVFCLLLVLAVHLTLWPSAVKAGTFTVTPRYAGSFDAQDNSLGMLDLSQPQDATVVHQFDFNVELADMADGESFGAVAFNIDLGSGISQARGGWQADDSTYDVSNPFGSTTKPLWSNNGDLGGSPSDFQAILSMMNATSAKATNFGRSEDGPTRLGSIFVLWDGSSDGRIDISPIVGSSMAIYTEDNDGMSMFKATADGFRSGGFQFGENAGQTAPVDYVPPVRRPMPIVDEPVVTEPMVPVVVDPVDVPPMVVDPIVTEPVIIDPIETSPEVIEPVILDPIYVDPIAEPSIVIAPSIPEPPTLPPVVFDPIVPDVVEPVVVLPPVVITLPAINPIAVDPIVTEPIVIDPMAEPPIIVDPLPVDPIDISPLMPEVPIRQPVVDLPDPIIDDPIIADPIDALPKVVEPVVVEPVVVEPVDVVPVDDGPIIEPPFTDDPLPILPIHAHWADGDEDVQYEVLFPMIDAIEYPRIVYRWVDENGFTREGFRYPGMDDEWGNMPLIITLPNSALLTGTTTPFAASGPALPEPSTIALIGSGIFLLLSGHRRRRKR